MVQGDVENNKNYEDKFKANIPFNDTANYLDYVSPTRGPPGCKMWTAGTFVNCVRTIGCSPLS